MNPSHLWIRRTSGVVECAKCGTRVTWTAAERPCKIQKLDLATKRLIRSGTLAAITEEEVERELRAAINACVEDERDSFSLHSPASTYGRDGRRRTGI